MSDLSWLQIVDNWLTARHPGATEADLAAARDRLRASEYYDVARAQFRAGASERVVSGLLERASRE